jgi:CRP/FNR family cyclic AMP-dependent transcriptional regulator
MSWIDFLGCAAALTVLACFCMTAIASLRSVAIASNLMFILYGTYGHIYPILFLHLTLLPINIIKLYRTLRPPQEHGRPKALNPLHEYRHGG